jgi:predicted ATP-dependent endonuclease of OLD family
MIIRAFHIKNYRSVIDSGTCLLSQDKITALIGQNESGKTSVLEALLSFYDGRITDDILRSDLTFPEITCVFALENETLGQLIDLSHLPAELQQTLKVKKEVRLMRKWLNAQESIFAVAETELDLFFTSLKEKSEASGKRIMESAVMLEEQIRLNSDKKQVQKSDLNREHLKQEESAWLFKKAKKTESASGQETESQGVQQSQKLELCKKYRAAGDSIIAVMEELKNTNAQFREASHHLEICSSEKEARNISRRLEQLRSNQQSLSERLRENTLEYKHLEKLAVRILDGMPMETALRESAAELSLERQYSTAEELGMQLLKCLPVFVFFEDFSSLLPNKIDLDDLLNENRSVEGYNAAQNFLKVAGLTSDFFREKNHRILKQMIENLNSEITVNFQDYWCQRVGKDDKIRLNFELEHYDNTIPEKSGKPYLEFWIKDNQERLYPKQRSRGVRWFLSFYLELKATAKENHRNRVLLIDEPGLSLHARAQEDVLKVFEDLKGNMQIIYCTHSPHLIDIQKLHRIMAVQRANTEEETSETLIFDTSSLAAATPDTLTPIYSLMGTRLNDRQFIYPKQNIIVGDTATFFFLETLKNIFAADLPVHFIPSSGEDGILIMANLLFGWKIEFGVLCFDNPAGKAVADTLRKNIFAGRDAVSDKNIGNISGFTEVEDLFSTIDFKRHVLKQRVGITESNSQYISSNNLSRIILASDFSSYSEKDKPGREDFDEESRSNFELVFTAIRKIIS